MVNRLFRGLLSVVFFINIAGTPAIAEIFANPLLPAPGAAIELTAPYTPAILAGITIHPETPLQFDFIMDRGDDHLQGAVLKEEGLKMIKYFLAALTLPNDQMWVNLSPYEKERIIPQAFGETLMGRDLLAQDYLLKQLTASLINPEESLGAEFWERVYARAREELGTTDIPLEAFHKIWIVPERAVVYEHNGSAIVAGRHLKVMLEEDYVALAQGHKNTEAREHSKATSIIRDVLIPEIEREVNEGRTFANLRQITNAMILATWFKQSLRQSLLGQVYLDQSKVEGVEVEDKAVKHKIYQQYLAAFEQGVFNSINEEYDPVTQQIIPRKYFSGGMTGVEHVTTQTDPASLSNEERGKVERVQNNTSDFAVLTTNLWEIGPESNRNYLKEFDAAQLADHEKNGPTRRTFLKGLLGAIATAAVGPELVGKIARAATYEDLVKEAEAEAKGGDSKLTKKAIKQTLNFLLKSKSKISGLGFSFYTKIFEKEKNWEGYDQYDRIYAKYVSQIYDQSVRAMAFLPEKGKAFVTEREDFYSYMLNKAPRTSDSYFDYGDEGDLNYDESYIHRDVNGTNYYYVDDPKTGKKVIRLTDPNTGKEMRIPTMEAVLEYGEVEKGKDGIWRDRTSGEELNGHLWKYLATKGSPFIKEVVEKDGKITYKLVDQESGETISWPFWQALSGENAWVAMGALQDYTHDHGKKKIDSRDERIRLAQQLANTALYLMADLGENEDGEAVGAIRMGPKGNYHESGDEEFYYNTISTEHNLSWYAALRMLYETTNDKKYLTAMNKIKNYIKSAYDQDALTFRRGMGYENGEWSFDTVFATDIQLWAILLFGAKEIDSWVGEESAYQLWEETKKKAGVYIGNRLRGVDFTDSKKLESGRDPMISIEWTNFAIMALRELAKSYPKHRFDLKWYADEMADHLETLAVPIKDDKEMKNSRSYPYATARDDTGHDWETQDPLVLAAISAAWTILRERKFNPFHLGGVNKDAAMMGLISETLKEMTQDVVLFASNLLGSTQGYLGLRKEFKISEDMNDDPGLRHADSEEGDKNADSALMTLSRPVEPVGGIDLNPAMLDLQIQRDENGLPLPLSQQPLENINIKGFLPVILRVTPMTGMPLPLGLNAPGEEDKTTGSIPPRNETQTPLKSS